jgi:hypothetical protein
MNPTFFFQTDFGTGTGICKMILFFSDIQMLAIAYILIFSLFAAAPLVIPPQPAENKVQPGASLPHSTVQV